jgi:hypothetical protein
MTTYKAKGTLLGNMWGGGMGLYPTVTIKADTMEELKKQIISGLDGSLDSGFGFESIKGAIMFTTATETREFDGREFTNEMNFEGEYYGQLSEEEKTILEEASCEY